MKERILKTNNDDGEYLKYRKDLKKFYENETLEYLKSEKLRIEVRYEDRKQNDVYSRLSFIVSIIALCMSILNFLISENERDRWYGWMGYKDIYTRKCKKEYYSVLIQSLHQVW